MSRSSSLVVSVLWVSLSAAYGMIVMGAAAVCSPIAAHLIIVLLSRKDALPLPGHKITFALTMKGIPKMTSYELIGRSRKSHETRLPFPISISAFAE